MAEVVGASSPPRSHRRNVRARGGAHGGGYGLPMAWETAQRWFRAAAVLGYDSVDVSKAVFAGQSNLGKRASDWSARFPKVAAAQHDLAELSSLPRRPMLSGRGGPITSRLPEASVFRTVRIEGASLRDALTVC
jgi:hypothetical protein